MLLSFLSTGDPNAVVPGTEDLQTRYEEQFGPGDYRPNLPLVFWSFRVMIIFGMSTVALSMLGLWLTRRRRRGTSAATRAPREIPTWFARFCVLALPLPTVAMIAGWLLSEIGRQPWTVQGELLTAASVSPGVSLAEVAVSLAVFTTLYGALALAEAILLTRHVKAGPEPAAPTAPLTPPPSRDDEDADVRLQPTLMY